MIIKKIFPENTGEILLKTNLEIYNNFIKDKNHNKIFIVQKFTKEGLINQTLLQIKFRNEIFLEINFKDLKPSNLNILKNIIPANMRPFVIFENNKIFICHGFYLYQTYKDNFILIIQPSSITDTNPNNIKIFSTKNTNLFLQQNKTYNLLNQIFPIYFASYTPFSDKIKNESGLIKRLCFLKQNF